MIQIPNDRDLEIAYIVCDYNGTIAKDGVVLPEIEGLFKTLSKSYRIFVITADTFGSVKEQVSPFGCEIKILSSSDHTAEKAAFIEELGASACVALGNGNNDLRMLAHAALGIAVMGDEGCSKETLLAADIVCKSAAEALELLLYPKRLIATLRR
jgi:soluble P-type ATPase